MLGNKVVRAHICAIVLSFLALKVQLSYCAVNDEELLVSSCFPKDRAKDQLQNGIQSIACVAASLIPLEQSYWIEFKEDGHEKNAKNCLLTCQNVYPNTSVALVYLAEEKSSSNFSVQSLDCRCALSTAIIRGYVGPEIFCDKPCETSSSNGKEEDYKCGGLHNFTDGASEVFYSAYCLNTTISNNTTLSPPNPPIPTTISPLPPTTTTMTSTSTEKPNDTSTEDPTVTDFGKSAHLLNSILRSLVSANVASIVMIGLMVMVVILVIILVIWAYLFIENYQPGASARFYGKRSPDEENTRSPIIGGNGNDRPNNKESYGTTNQAFDPSPEREENDDVPVKNLPINENHKVIPGMTSSEDDEEEDDSSTPRALSSTGDLDTISHEGNSTFYYGERPDGHVSTAKLDTVSTASTVEMEKVGTNEK